MGEAVREELSRVGTPCRCKLAPRWQGGGGEILRLVKDSIPVLEYL